MRIATTKKYVLWCIYATLALIIVSAVIILGVFFGICHPISAFWTNHGHCAGPSVIIGLSYFTSVQAIISDFTCAIIPTFILYNLQMDRRVKASVVVILSLGFVSVRYRLTAESSRSANDTNSASAATLVRLKYINNYTATVNHIRKSFQLSSSLTTS